VTFLFTDIEGSTRLWERDAPAMQKALVRHDEILRGAIEGHGGYVFKTVGDAFCAAFSGAPNAVEAVLAAQRALFSEEWDADCAIKARMALHTGLVEERGGDYFGPPVNRVARLLSAGHGGQTLLSLATQELVRRDGLPQRTELRDLGERYLKDLFRPERVFQLLAPDLPSSFPPLKTLDARLNNLPVQPTPLVGREEEVAEVRGRLQHPDARLLTLTGPGGTGKTRLALQAAAELLDEFEDGAFFVALAPVTDPQLVASTIAKPLGVVESGEQPLEEGLKDYLQEKELLLLLDNFEQVLGAAALVGELLRSCPGLKVLATSRAALRVYGEQEYAVPPLAVPDPRLLPGIAIEKLGQYEAVRLFIERARAVKADFEVTGDNAPAVAGICARLDGLPLAIELAAARTRLLSPEAMLSRLGSRLKLLRGGARDLPARQQTLRGAIGWSHDLLDEGERALFRRLSVFVGGFALEAAEEVCAAEGDLLVDVLDGVDSLVGKSLFRRGEGPNDERFLMLETIREYALERLEESGEAGAIRKAHAEHFLALAEEAEPEPGGSQPARWLEHLETEHDNLRAALSWALESGSTELALRLAGALWPFWEARGHFGEGRRWLEEALTRDGRPAAAPSRTKALAGVAWLALYQGDFERIAEAYEEDLELSARTAPASTQTIILRIARGIAARAQGDAEQATRLLEEGLATSRGTGDRAGIALCLLNLGGLWSLHSDHERAVGLLEEGLALGRDMGDPALLAALLVTLGYEFLLQGDHERAAALNEEAATLLREQGYRTGLETALDNLGWAALLRGDDEDATDLLKESLRFSEELGSKLTTAESLDGLACVAGTRGEAGRAARLFGAAGALREAIGAPLPPAARALRAPYLRAARSRLDEAAWTEALEEGRAMTHEGALAIALEGSDGSKRARGAATR